MLTASQLPLEEFFKTYHVGSFSFSPDETEFVFVSDRSGHSLAYNMPLHGGAWRLVLHSDKRGFRIHSPANTEPRHGRVEDSIVSELGCHRRRF